MIYTNSDGGSRGNPGPGAIGVIIREDGTILKKERKFIGEQVTNNVAEYNALILALELASEFTTQEITCLIDSELVVNQLLGEYKVKHPKMKELFLQVQKLQDNFEKVIYLHVTRNDRFQQLADELVNDELNRRGYNKKIYFRKR